jgi:hypothetical protein
MHNRERERKFLFICKYIFQFYYKVNELAESQVYAEHSLNTTDSEEISELWRCTSCSAVLH